VLCTTCCLRDVDGLSIGWENGVPLYWQIGENGKFEISKLPRGIRTMLKPADLSLFFEVDKSKFGYYSQLAQERQDRTNDNDNEEQCKDKLLVVQSDEEEEERSLSVSDLSLKRFRSLLVENFDILFNQQRIVWPTRLPSKPRDVPSERTRTICNNMCSTSSYY